MLKKKKKTVKENIASFVQKFGIWIKYKNKIKTISKKAAGQNQGNRKKNVNYFFYSDKFLKFSFENNSWYDKETDGTFYFVFKF